MASDSSQAGKVAALWRYPVKSMMGEEIGGSAVSDRGLAGDRAYALLDTATGKVASAKNPRKWPGMFGCRAAYTMEPTFDGTLPPVRIDLFGGKTLLTNDPSAGSLLSQALGCPVTLATIAPEVVTIENYSPDLDGAAGGGKVSDIQIAGVAPAGSFFDSSAVHLITTASLDRLRRLYPQGRIDARRFRPNIVVSAPSGMEGFVENNWSGRTLGIGAEVRLAILRPARRCVMTTLAQGDLPEDLNILRAITRHNSLFFQSKGGRYPCFGVLAKVVRGGRIRQGDPCQLE